MKEFVAAVGVPKGGLVLTSIARIKEFCDGRRLYLGLGFWPGCIFFSRKEKSISSIHHFHRFTKKL
jgi:hypothetical protein